MQSSRGLRTLIFDVVDLARAKAFYARALGRPPYFDQPFYVGFDVGGYELGLRPAAPGAGGMAGYFDVADVDRAVERLVGLGATVREAPQEVGGGIRVAVVADPLGNAFGLIRNPNFAPPVVAAAAGDVDPREVRHEVVVPLVRADVWKLFSSREGITSWLVDSASIELRIGGPYELYFLPDNEPGTRGSEGCRVLSFLPERMLSFTWNAPPELPTREAHTWVVLEFADALTAASAPGTRVTLTHLGWPTSGLRDNPAWEETYRYFDRAWRGLLGALVQYSMARKPK